MRGAARMAILAVLAACAANPVAAQPPISQAPVSQARVSTLPLHDADITYRLEGSARDAIPGGPETVRLLWEASRQRVRVEAPGRNQVLLVDLQAPRAELLDTGLHGVVTLPMRAKDVEPITLGDARLTRRGTAVVAGLPCTEYDVAAKRGTGRICLTADGVALRGTGNVDGRQGSFTALAVVSGPIAEAAFTVPSGYMRLAIPGLGQLR